MALPGDHDGDAVGLVGESQTPLHLQLLREAGESLPELRAVNAQAIHTELDTLKEHFSLLICVLVRMNNVASQLPDEVGNLCDEPFLVRAGQQESGSRGERRSARTVRHP